MAFKAVQPCCYRAAARSTFTVGVRRMSEARTCQQDASGGRELAEMIKIIAATAKTAAINKPNRAMPDRDPVWPTSRKTSLALGRRNET